jgi:hypothetical protein
MKCPHCTTSIHPSWHPTIVNTTDGKGNYIGTVWRIQYMTCPECKKSILRFAAAKFGKGFVSDPKEEDWQLFFPAASARAPLPKVVPSPIAKDYNEAARVLAISPKASAALSRRCLQAVLSEAGYTQRDLSQQIDAVLSESDTSKSLPSATHMIVDAIRNFGNFAAHKITDKTTLEIIEVEPTEAEYCLDVLDAVFDHYFVKPAQAAAIKANLNAKLAAARKPPAK